MTYRKNSYSTKALINNISLCKTHFYKQLDNLYPQIATSVVTSNCNNNSSQLYYIYNQYKMIEERYKSYEIISNIGK